MLHWLSGIRCWKCEDVKTGLGLGLGFPPVSLTVLNFSLLTWYIINLLKPLGKIFVTRNQAELGIKPQRWLPYCTSWAMVAPEKSLEMPGIKPEQSTSSTTKLYPNLLCVA